MTTASSHRALLEDLSAFAEATDFDQLPKDVSASTCLRVLDTMGIALAARTAGVADGAIELRRTHRWPR